MRLKKRLAALTELPESAFGCTYIEIESDTAIRINGCHKIVDYSNERVVLSTSEYDVTVIGRELTLTSYGERTAEVRGKIISVDLGGGGIC